jgi:hypothetical protein
MLIKGGNLDENILRSISNVQFNDLKYLDLSNSMPILGDCMIQNL